MTLFLCLVCYIAPAIATLVLWLLCVKKHNRPGLAPLGLLVALVPFLNIVAIVALGNMLLGLKPGQ